MPKRPQNALAKTDPTWLKRTQEPLAKTDQPNKIIFNLLSSFEEAWDLVAGEISLDHVRKSMLSTVNHSTNCN